MAETPYVREADYARRYRHERFSSGTGHATDARERRVIERLLARLRPEDGRWLDVPAGTGRLSGLLPGEPTLVDRAAEMLGEASGDRTRVVASAHRLPFADQSFAGVLCMRLMHHIPTSAERVAILRELRRVSRGALIASFFDSWSLQNVRRVVARRLGKTRSGRCAVSVAQLERDLGAAGWRADRFSPLRRFISEQTLVLAL